MTKNHAYYSLIFDDNNNNKLLLSIYQLQVKDRLNATRINAVKVSLGMRNWPVTNVFTPDLDRIRVNIAVNLSDVKIIWRNTSELIFLNRGTIIRFYRLRQLLNTFPFISSSIIIIINLWYTARLLSHSDIGLLLLLRLNFPTTEIRLLREVLRIIQIVRCFSNCLKYFRKKKKPNNYPETI